MHSTFRHGLAVAAVSTQLLHGSALAINGAQPPRMLMLGGQCAF